MRTLLVVVALSIAAPSAAQRAPSDRAEVARSRGAAQSKPPVEGRVRQLCRRRARWMGAGVVSMLAGAGLLTAGAIQRNRGCGDCDDGLIPLMASPYGIGLGIVMLSIGGRAGRGARRLERTVFEDGAGTLEDLGQRRRRRGRRLMITGGTFFALGLGTVVAGLAVVGNADGCEDDDWCIIDGEALAGAALALAGTVVAVAGTLMITFGMKNRKRAQALDVGLGPTRVSVALRF